MPLREKLGRWLPPRVWLPALVVTLLLMLSLGVLASRDPVPVYRAMLAPAAGSGGPGATITLGFFGQRLDEYLAAGQLELPPGWHVERAPDASLLRSTGPAEPLRFTGYDDRPVHFVLVQHAGAGSAVLDNGAGQRRQFDLRVDGPEKLHQVAIGGETSALPRSGMEPRYPLTRWLLAIAAVFLVLLAIGVWLAGGLPRRHTADVRELPPPRWEIAACALPLLLACGTMLLAFLPGHVHFDGSLQWVQAANRGQIYAGIGLPTTYLMRLFSIVTPSPLPIIVLQMVAAAFGTALVLREMRYRRVPLWAVLLAVLLLALTPHYPALFTGLGKDALSLAGLLFFAWALLAAFRLRAGAQRIPTRLLAALVASALFAGLMRSNAMPVVLLVLATALVLLYRQGRDRRLLAAGAAFLVVAVALPAVLARAANKENMTVGRAHLPLGVYIVIPMYHMFGAAVSQDVPIPESDAELFFRIAPREAWARYDCSMTDVTMASVSNAMKLSSTGYHRHMLQNQEAMAAAVGRLLLRHPELLLQRQLCITRMLWHIDFGKTALQTTITLGYDSVDPRFVKIAGESWTPWPQLRQVLHKYQLWTERAEWMWLFWKPALPLLLGAFIVSMYLQRRRDTGVLLVALLPLASILLLFVIIPFPAYRYAYPSVLLMLLLSTLAFARRPAASAP